MSTSGGTRVRRQGKRAGGPRGSDDHPTLRPRRARRRLRAVLLIMASLILLVALGLKITHTIADNAAASQAAASQVLADKAAAVQVAADKVAADQALADKAAADQVAADIKRAKAAQPAPGTQGLDPSLAKAFTKARADALTAGLDLRINSGFRTAATQQHLYDDALAKYGSAATARHWVLPPAESDHVKGRAIDVAPAAGAAWLEKHGVSYGLCRRYVNEWWHFELLAPAAGQRCPAMEPFAGG